MKIRKLRSFKAYHLPATSNNSFCPTHLSDKRFKKLYRMYYIEPIVKISWFQDSITTTASTTPSPSQRPKRPAFTKAGINTDHNSVRPSVYPTDCTLFLFGMHGHNDNSKFIWKPSWMNRDTFLKFTKTLNHMGNVRCTSWAYLLQMQGQKPCNIILKSIYLQLYFSNIA